MTTEPAATDQGPRPGGPAPLAYLDCFAGIAGDMLLGALLDAGASTDALLEGLRGVPVGPFQVAIEATKRRGIGATLVRVSAPRSPVVRTWGYLRGALLDAELPAAVRERALATFTRLAAAEGRVHRKPPDQVHFHEVGAVDAVVDVVGAALLLEDLGVQEVAASPVATGSGRVRTEHGMLPVPSPAVLELLREVPVYAGGVGSELTTPTGAALLVTAASGFGPMPAMRVRAVGYGAGTRQHDELPNVLRAVLGERALAAAEEPDGSLVLEANIDDMSAELAPWVLDRLFAAGAVDVWYTPVHMKKGRPGLTLSVLSPPGREATLREVLWRETSTLGVRGIPVRKWMLERREITVEVAGTPIRVKLGLDQDRIVNAAPEFEDCAHTAGATGMPLKEVMARAQAGALATLDADHGPADPT